MGSCVRRNDRARLARHARAFKDSHQETGQTRKGVAAKLHPRRAIADSTGSTISVWCAGVSGERKKMKKRLLAASCLVSTLAIHPVAAADLARRPYTRLPRRPSRSTTGPDSISVPTPAMAGGVPTNSRPPSAHGPTSTFRADWPAASSATTGRPAHGCSASRPTAAGLISTAPRGVRTRPLPAPRRRAISPHSAAGWAGQPDQCCSTPPEASAMLTFVTAR